MTLTLKRIEGFIKYKDLLKQLVLKDVKLKYRRSFLGYVWSVLNPLLIMCVMTLVFSTVFKRNIENYPVYLFTGQLLFNYMNTSTHQAISSITSSGALLKKVYVPKYIFTLAKITSGLVDFFFSLGALILVMVVTGAKFSLYNLLGVFVAFQLYLFCLGLGLFLAQANVFFRDIQYIYNAVTTAWIYFTPLFYTLDALDPRVSWLIKHFNPMYFYVGQFRDLVYYNTMPGPKIMLAGWVTAVLMLIIGLYTFQKNQDKFILYI